MTTTKPSEVLNDLLDTWDNKEKAQAISILKESMSKSVPNRTPHTEVRSYINSAVKEGYRSGKIKDYPFNADLTAKSLAYKEVIQDTLQELSPELTKGMSPIVLSIWEHCLKSKTLIEFRANFKLFLNALNTELYTKDDILSLMNEIELKDSKLERLRDIERQYKEVIGYYVEDDESLSMAMKDFSLKSKGMTDIKIAETLGISRPSLLKLRRKHLVSDAEKEQ